MDDKRLIPYSVHLPKETFDKLKEFAGNRKASALVRDALALILEGDDKFAGGYKKGLRDCIAVIKKHHNANAIAIDNITIADDLIRMIGEQ
jgi:hypothetical protein